MKRLDLNIGYDVTDLSPLAGMTQLESMQLFSSNSGNFRSGITDLSPLAGMTRLNYLRMDIGDVEDFSPLSGLTALTELHFYGDYMVEDLSFLRGMTELRNLQMGGSTREGAPVLDDLTDLSGLTKLADLQLMVPVASLDGLEGATALRTLRMYGSGSTYTDVDALAGLTELVELNLPYRRYDYPLPPVDISGLKNLTNLQTLTVSTGVDSLEPLRGLTELRALQIQANDSADAPALSLEPLSGLTKLTDLQFYGRVQNGDLSALSGLTELHALQIYHQSWNRSGSGNDRTYIRDLSPLAGLTKLNSLQVNGTAEHIDTSPVSFVSNLSISE